MIPRRKQLEKWRAELLFANFCLAVAALTYALTALGVIDEILLTFTK